MALLSDTDPDLTPRNTLCCNSTVGAYKHIDPEKKGKKERRELKTERGGWDFIYAVNLNTEPSGKTNPNKFLCRVQIRLCTEQWV